MNEAAGFWLLMCGLFLGFILGCLTGASFARFEIEEACKGESFVIDQQKYGCKATGEWVKQ